MSKLTVSQGTPPFMAVEVDSNRHRFRPRQLLKPPWKRRLEQCQKTEKGEVADSKSNSLSDSRTFCRLKLAKSSHPPFDYNPLHDLESLWWLAAQFVFELADQETRGNLANEDDQARLEELRAVASKLFNNPAARQRTICDEDAFTSDIDCLQGDILRAGQALERWRQQLVECYIKSEKDSEAVRNTDFVGLHDSFIATMAIIEDLSESIHLKSGSSQRHSTELVQFGESHDTRKRSREPDEAALLQSTSSKKSRVV